jgi:hypothetical protein
MISTPRSNDPPWRQHLWRLYRRLARKQVAYRQIPDAVLTDLAVFCRAHAPAATEREIGRRDVWLRLMHFRRMHDEELAVLYAGLSPEQRHQLWRPGATYIEEE